MSTIHQTFPLPAGRRLEICQGDLTQEPVDAIVNAANSSLSHGGGIAAAISRGGGPTIQRESDAWVREHGPVSHAEPAYTSAGRLPARYVIHAVGPVMGEGDEDRKLADAIRGSLRRASELNLKSIAFPAISAGIFSVPKELVARVFFQTIPAFFEETPQSSLEVVKIVLWGAEMLEIFLQAGKAAFPS